MSSGRRRAGDLYGGRLLVLAALVALVAVWIVSLVAVWDTHTTTEGEVFGHLTAALVLVLFALLIKFLGRGVGGLVLGKDNRISTSKIQVVLWTAAIGFGFLSLIAETWVGADAGFDVLIGGNFEFEPYLVLLGGPFLAAIGARALIGAQVGNGDSAKPPGQPQASQAVTNDSGDADLVDCQYLLFNLIALIYFFGAFFQDPALGLPEIPTVIYVLTGASALAYVSNKAIPSGPPKIESISPATGPVGEEVTIFGSGLLFPRDATATTTPTDVDKFHEVQVMIGGRMADIVPGSLSSTRSGGDRLKVKVPSGLQAGQEYDVVALNFRGTRSDVEGDAVKFHVV